MAQLQRKSQPPIFVYAVLIFAANCFTVSVFATNFHSAAESAAKKSDVSTNLRTVPVSTFGSTAPVTKQLGTQELPLVVKINPELKSEAERAREENERTTKEKFDRWLMLSSIATSIFTAVLGIFTIMLAVETRRLRRLGDKQSEDTRDSLAITKRSVDAALALERPILVIERISISPLGGGALIEFGNHGRTPATITCDCLVTKLEHALPSKPRYSFNTQQKVLNSRIVDSGKSYEVARQSGPSVDDWAQALADKSILWAYGFIECIDFLKERRRTGFCLAFSPLPNGQTMNRSDGYWVLEGPYTYTYDMAVTD